MSNNTVKITGGKYRGRAILTPGGKTHPMGERERLALFNMITEYVQGSTVIDLYCGGGTLGIEALSRGARRVVFVDKEAMALRTVKENLCRLGIDDVAGVEVVRADAVTVAEEAAEQFDVVLADPPYDRYDAGMVDELSRLVLDGGILVLSHPGEAPELEGLQLMKTRRYSGAHISIYAKD